MDSWVVNGVTHHAAILIANKGMDVQQSWVVDDLDGASLSSFISANSARLVDWRQYVKNGVTVNGGVLVSNTGAGEAAWWFYPGLTQAQVDAQATAHNAMVVSLQIADTTNGTFNVVMIQNAGVGAVNWWWGKTDAQLATLVNPGTMRIVDSKSYRVNGTRLYTTLVANNTAYAGTSATNATCDANLLASWQANPPVVGLGSAATAKAFDAQVLAFMKQYGLPGGAIGVVRNGQLVLARGYGYADEAGAQIAHPDNLFRLASLSKGITAAAVLVAQQQGLLTLDTHPFQILGLSPNPAATSQSPVTPQLNAITVRNLLNHTGGFSSETGCSISVPAGAPAADQPLHGTSCSTVGDPMSNDTLFTVEDLPGNSVPPTCNQIVQYMMTQPVTWTPGQVMDYSNFGYCVLEATLEKVTGVPFAEWATNNVLNPAGAENGIVPGHTVTVADHEVTYYDPGYPLQSIYDTQGLCQQPGTANANGLCVPIPYGGVGPTSTGDIEAALPEGGWVASPVDLLRLQVALDGRSGGSPLLSLNSIASLETSPNVWYASAANGTLMLNPPNPNYYYGFGFDVAPNGSWQNVGDFNGTVTYEYRGGTSSRTDNAAGFGWVAVFNGTPNDPKNTVGSQIGNMMFAAFNGLGGAAAPWMNANLFDQFGVYSQWMTGSQYQTLFNAQVAAGLYPSRIEGRDLMGTPMYRAFFAPVHGSTWTSNNGMDCVTYQSKQQSLAAQGYTTASLQAYVGGDGLRRYQATWVK